MVFVINSETTRARVINSTRVINSERTSTGIIISERTNKWDNMGLGLNRTTSARLSISLFGTDPSIVIQLCSPDTIRILAAIPNRLAAWECRHF